MSFLWRSGALSLRSLSHEENAFCEVGSFQVENAAQQFIPPYSRLEVRQ
jgi:hypothetical protein